MKSSLLVSLLFFISANAVANERSPLRPSGKGYAVAVHAKTAVKHAAGLNGIDYHGGPLMGTDPNRPVSVYYLWYGNWYGNTATTILPAFAKAIGGSPYFNINSTYTDGLGLPVINQVAYRGGTAVSSRVYSKTLSDDDIVSLVRSVNPVDTNGVYFVLTSPDVTATSGFCRTYCAYHGHASINGLDIKYALVGDAATQCPYSCEIQTARSPNGNPGADGMANLIAHELSEAVTDPDLTGWYDALGRESSDKCAWQFGAPFSFRFSMANVRLGARYYMIQQNWVNGNGGYCAMGF